MLQLPTIRVCDIACSSTLTVIALVMFIFFNNFFFFFWKLITYSNAQYITSHTSFVHLTFLCVCNRYRLSTTHGGGYLGSFQFCTFNYYFSPSSSLSSSSHILRHHYHSLTHHHIFYTLIIITITHITQELHPEPLLKLATAHGLLEWLG